VSKRIVWLLLLMPLLLCAESANAQGTHEFLGAPREVPDRFSPRHGIRYNTQGFDQPQAKWNKKISKWQKKQVPDWAVQEILSYPGTPDAIGQWIDDAFDQVQAQFTACGGSLADRARRVSPRGVTVRIMPSAFFEPHYKINVAGAYYPSSNEIKVLNIYYTWSGANKGWLRHAKDLLVWEMGNFLGVQSGILPEPRDTGWPCNAPPLK
jgi:hypothetical protein